MNELEQCKILDFDKPFIQRLIDEQASCQDIIGWLQQSDYNWHTRLMLILLLERALYEYKSFPEELGPFLSEATYFKIHGRMKRLASFHEIKNVEGLLEGYQWVVQRPCHISLAPYFISAEMVLTQLYAQVHVCEGEAESIDGLELEILARLEGLSDLERDVIRLLIKERKALWVAPWTPQHLNALVSYPYKTVALVLRLPGSDRELEIKRVGFNKKRPFSYIFEKDGVPYDKTHRLQGCSMHRQLQLEAKAARMMSLVWREIHNEEPPMSASLAVNEVLSVPWQRETLPLLEYLTSPKVWGEAHADQKDNLLRCAKAFVQGESDSLNPGGPYRNASLCLHYGTPGQTLLEGTSCLRLDRICSWLTEEGVNTYFKGNEEALDWPVKHLMVREVLWSVLGDYPEPSGSFRDVDTYVAAVFDSQQQRRQADIVYDCMLRTFAKFWGTLYAMRGCTRGESFVARNVGIRSVWKENQWQPEIVFMDHDDMHLEKPHLRLGYEPRLTLVGFRLDRMYILGHEGEGIRGSLSYLAEVYRIPPDEEIMALERFKAWMAEAYWKTTHSIAGTDLSEYFSGVYLRSGEFWDFLVSDFLSARKADNLEEWRNKTAQAMLSKGFWKLEVQKHLDTIIKFGDIYDIFPGLVKEQGNGSHFTRSAWSGPADSVG